MVRHAQNIRRAAIIAFQPHNANLGKVAFEIQNVRQVRAAPTVNALVRISRHCQVGVVDRQAANDRILGQIRVLIFVHQNEPISVVQLTPQLGRLPQHQPHMHQQVVEVHGVCRPKLLLVNGINLRNQGSGRVARARRVLIGRDQLPLGPANGRGQLVGRRETEIDSGFLRGKHDRLAALRIVVDREVFGQPDERRVAAKKLRAESMKRPDPDRRAGRKLSDPQPHLVGRLVRKRQRQDLVRRDAVLQEMYDAMCYDSRLAAAGTGKHQQRTLDMLHGRSLSFRELRGGQSSGHGFERPVVRLDLL